MKTLYDVLDLDSECCSSDDIKSAYRRLILKHHPDKNYDGKSKCTEEYISIQRAYRILSEQKSRTEYNAWLREQTLRRNDEHLIVYDSVICAEIEQDTRGSNEFQCLPCRCGDFFQIKRDDIDALVDFVLVPCGVCSLYLKIQRSKT